MRFFALLILSTSAFAAAPTNFANLGNYPTNIAYTSNFLAGVTHRGSNGQVKLFSIDDILSQAGGGGSPGGANDALQFRQSAGVFGGADHIFTPAGRSNISMAGELFSFRAAITNKITVGTAQTNTGDFSSILGGATNRIESPWSVIGGGRNNLGYGSDLSNAVWVIAGGEDNKIALGNNKHAVLSGGQSNLIINARYGTIAGGWVHKLGNANNMHASNSVIGGGWENTNDGFNSTIAGGYKNQIYHATNDFVANTIGGGGFNFIRGSYSVIAGGSQNTITNQGWGASDGEGLFIGAGRGNYADGHKSSVVGGENNIVTNDCFWSFIGGGIANIMRASRSSIVGGNGNEVAESADYSVVGGGILNYIGIGSENSSIIGGQRNRIADFVTDAHAIGMNVTNETASTVEIGVANTTKTQFDATGFNALGTIRGAGGASITGGITNAALTASLPVLTDANKRLTSGAIDLANTGHRTGTLPGTSVQTNSASAPGIVKIGVADKVWKTDGSGNPDWRDDATGAGGGDAMLVNATAISDSGSLTNVAQAASAAGITWTVASGADPDPDKISLAISAASESGAGIWTAAAQTLGGDKRFTGVITNASALRVEDESTFVQEATFNANALVQGELQVSGEAIHGGPIQYITTAISASEIDWDSNSSRKKTLAANTTFTFANLSDDRHVYVSLTQDATGTRTVTWPTATWLGHTNQSGTLTHGGINTNANFVTVFHFWRDAGTVYGEVVSSASSRFDVEWSSGSVPSSDVASRVSDETGSGLLVFANGPSLGTAGVATNANLNFVYVTNNNAFALTTQFVATNSTVNSNLTMNVNIGVQDLFLTNNVSLTNFSNLEAATSKTVTWHLYPTLVNRTIVWPTLGAPGHAVYWRTNANSPMWTTLTNGVMYVLSTEWRNTNCWASISEWK